MATRQSNDWRPAHLEPERPDDRDVELERDAELASGVEGHADERRGRESDAANKELVREAKSHGEIGPTPDVYDS